ncbi:MAG: hypothetical protein H6868_03965 [Rhodospirillales bacterium]|nr:hypothetical protein [Rhodospirillales bacterium]
MNIEYNIRGLLNALFRQKKKIILVFSLFFVLGFAVVLRIEPVYEARGSLLVKFGQGARPDVNLPGNNRPNELTSSDRKEIMESNIRILKSQSLLSDVVSAVGVEKLYPGLAADDEQDKAMALRQATGRILGAVSVQTSGASNIIEVAVRHKDPEVSALFTDKLMEMFMIRQAEVYNTAQTSFLEKQTTEMKQKLEVSRQDFFDFKEEVGISAIDEEMTQLLRQKSELSNLAFQSVSRAQTTLSELEAKEAEMRSTYKANSPVMKRLRQSIDVARRQLHDRQYDLNATGKESGEETGDDADKQESSMNSKIAAIDERIAWLEAQRGKYNELEQRVKMDEENYVYYQQRGEEARINNLLNIENITRISVVDKPAIPMYPVPARKKLILIAFMMAGALFGLGVALTFELLDDRLTSPEQITSTLGVPVLAAFGKAKGA